MKNTRNNCDQVKQVRSIKPTRRSVSGCLPFRGAGGIPFESLLERDFLRRMRFSHRVESVIAQPVAVGFIDSRGCGQTYTPDFLVHYRQPLGIDYQDYIKPMLVEVKPSFEWRKNWRAWFSKWKAARRYARQEGWTFSIYDESRIRGLPLDNIHFLERFERLIFDQEEVEMVLATLRGMDIAPVHYLLARHFKGIYQDRGVALLWHLIAIGRVECDITEPLNQYLELWIATP
ncbi:TnsA endonuclease N-terminal domain-containing protein [Pseudomonas syringae pv. syringae]|nr:MULTISPECIES: TnsA endonuclease N-terminal domain-containing protein [Pseudomonas syringae group]MCH5552541.1 TnsA endonuclease N-terminal domain-containing protein [Pseudomonas syringae pv. syringae]